MPRITPTDVTDIIDTDLSDTRLGSFIAGAHQAVQAQLKDAGLDEELLKEIERWLSAHYVTAFERQAIQEKAGPVEQRFSDAFGMGLDSSTYGQTAKSLDPTGRLAVLGKKTIQLISISEK